MRYINKDPSGSFLMSELIPEWIVEHVPESILRGVLNTMGWLFKTVRTARFTSLIKRQLFIGLLAALLPAYSSASGNWLAPLLQNHALVGKIYSLEHQAFLSETDLLSELRSTAYLLIGEKHDNADHHRLEEKILTALNSPTPPYIVFEMLTDEQQLLTKTLQPNDTLQQMHDKLQWNDKGWPWRDYGPLINRAVQQGATITAGNINSALLKRIYKEGSANPELAAARFKSMISIAESVREKILDQIYESHCAMMPKEKLTPMLTIQLARDASMASAMIRDAETNKAPRPSILIAGSFHTQKNIGVPLHLHQLTRQPIKTLLLAEVSESHENPGDYASFQEADYIWFTPKQLDIDYCAGLRTQQRGSHKP